MSLRHRILLLWSVAVAALLVLCSVLFTNLNHAQEDAAWVERTKDIVLAVSEVQSSLRNAETGQRGYLLTERATYLGSYEQAIAAAWDALDRADGLFQNPSQKVRSAALRELIRQKLFELNGTIQLAKKGDFAGARRIVFEDRGKVLMDQINHLVGEINAVQAELLTFSRNAAVAQNERVRHIVLFGGPLIGIGLMLLGLTTTRRIGRPLQTLLEGTHQLSKGNFEHRLPVERNDELGTLAKAFNTMAESQATSLRARERADQALQKSNAELHRHDEVLDLLRQLAQRLQSATNEREFGMAMQQFAPRIFPGRSGALYAHNNSRNLLVRLAQWGDTASSTEVEPEACWALRRGQPHIVTDEPDVRCDHVATHAEPYACLPLTAGGDMVGLLHLMGRLSEVDHEVASALVENVALALVNHRLRASLREQSIRDPLTGLFNRRYMEEALALEFARADRTGEPVGIIMADIDHFKRFNDTFGHDAGDALLRAVGQLFLKQFRHGDIACRYGGEELTVILPSIGLADLEARAELVLQAVRDLSIVHKGQALGRITISLGLAIRLDHVATPSVMLSTADAALLRAKQTGRDRFETAPALVAML
ncbi:diguanylate cyclase [Azospirillum brasilense]|uniref:diguanylate cyclase n=1 Tax=Azospirillum brasilense TaxID=192 RepID=A0A235H4Z7_AZOBR|nr:diguanylate cyclase [Azospirillum brasilense]OYD80295.1 hypothetical protein CHT98_31905 [Azospirillum brasilense]